MKESLKKYYLMILNNRHIVGKWAKTNMVRVAMAAMVGLTAGMVVNSADAAVKGDYIAVAQTGTENSVVQFTDSAGNTYNYVIKTVNGKQYAIRDGWHLKNENNSPRYPKTQGENNLLTVYKENTNGSDPLFSTVDTTVLGTQTNTVLDKNIITIKDNGYVGAVNTSGIDTPYSHHYFILKDGVWTNVGSGENNIKANAYKAILSNGVWYADKNGNGVVNPDVDEVVSSRNVYLIGGHDYVFKNVDGSVYTGSVFGNNNELLKSMTAETKDAAGNVTGSYKLTVWGTDRVDADDELANLTVGQVNKITDTFTQNDINLAKADISKVEAVAGAAGSNVKNTYTLYRNDGENPTAVTGTIVDTDTTYTFNKTGGTGGNDVKVTVTPVGGTAQELVTGSIVTADNADKVTKITINGVEYNVVDTNTTNTKVEVTGEGTKTVTITDSDNNTVTTTFTDKDTTYTAGANVNISDTNEISATDTNNVTNLTSVAGAVQTGEGNTSKVDVTVTTTEDGTPVSKTGTLDLSTLTTNQGDTNATNIATNTQNIATNTSNINRIDQYITNNEAAWLEDNDTQLVPTGEGESAMSLSGNTVTMTVTDTAGNEVTGSVDISGATVIQNLDQRVTTNEGNIATNTQNIATNTQNIATNTQNIATNTQNIATNTQNIATNTQNIATNTQNINRIDQYITDNEDVWATDTNTTNTKVEVTGEGTKTITITDSDNKTVTTTFTDKDTTYTAGANVNISDTNEISVDLSEIQKEIVDVKINFSADKGDNVTIKNTETLAINGDDNITTTAADGAIQVTLNSEISVDQINLGDTVITENNITMGDTVITNESVTVGDTVINGDSITSTTINGDTVNATTINTETINLGDTVIEENNITMGDTVITNESVTVGDTVIDNSSVSTTTVNTTEINLGDTNITEERYLTLEEEAKKHTTVVEGANVTVTEGTNDDGGKEYTVSLKDVINVTEVNATTINGDTINGDTVNATTINTETINLGDTVITENNITMGDTIITNESITVGDTIIEGDTITTENIKLGDNVTLNETYITNLEAEAKAHTTVVEGANVTVTEGTNDDGGKEYTVSLKDVINVTEVNATTINGDTINGDTVNATTINTETINLGDTVITENNITMGDTIITNESITVGDTIIEGDTITTENIKLGDNVTLNETYITNLEAEAKAHTTVVEGANVTVTEGTNDDGGKEYTVALNSKIEVEEVKLGDTVITENNITMGDTVITNESVTVGDTVIDNSSVTTDTVNATTVNTENIKLGDTNITEQRYLDLEDEAQKHTTVVEGANVTVTEGENENGGKEYTVSLNSKIEVDEVKLGDTVITENNITMGDTVINGDSVTTETVNATTINGDTVNATTVNVGSTQITENNITMGDTVITNESVTVGNTVINGDSVTTETVNATTVNTENVKLGDTNITEERYLTLEDEAQKHTTVVEGANVTVTEGTNEAGGKEYTVALKDVIEVTEVKLGDTTITENEIKMGDTTITGDTITTTTINGDTINGDTVNATTVNAETVNVGDTVINGDSVTTNTVNTDTINLGNKTLNEEYFNKVEGDINYLTERVEQVDTNTTYEAGNDTVIVTPPSDPTDRFGVGTIKVNTDVIASIDYVDNKFIEYDSLLSWVTDDSSVTTDESGNKTVLSIVQAAADTVNIDMKELVTNQSQLNETKIQNMIDAGYTGDKYITVTKQTMDDKGNVTAGKIEFTEENLKNLQDAIDTNTTYQAADNTVIITKNEDASKENHEVYDVKVNTDEIATNASVDEKINNITNNTQQQLNSVNARVNKVGARAAALAALHPMDFDPDDKLTFSAGYGNYKGENAAAIGAFYRPDEKVMFSVAGTMSDKDNMINAGVSFSLDRTAHVTNSKTAMAREILDLREQVNELKNLVMKLAYKNQDVEMFPDVPENHWAYEYVEGLQKAGIIEGYPNGTFAGDRACTRYEFAALLFRALKAGQIVPEKLMQEFKPELGRFRVDRIAGEDATMNKVERVRVNTGKAYEGRDVYGSKMAK